MDRLIDIDELAVAYGTKTVLRHVSLTVCKHDFLGIIGPNGGGKTTLLKTILGLIKPQAGRIQFYRDGGPVPAIKIGYLPQINRIDRRFPIEVYDVVASGLAGEARKRLFGYQPEQRQRIADVLEMAGLTELARRPVGELSGGQLQRALLGRAIVAKPDVLALDEPNTYVDKQFESRLYELLEQINRHTAIILVSHDIGTILPLVKNVACVNETLHYHPGNDLTEQWLDDAFHCPIELVAHGHLPHRILGRHEHRNDAAAGDS